MKYLKINLMLSFLLALFFCCQKNTSSDNTTEKNDTIAFRNIEQEKTSAKSDTDKLESNQKNAQKITQKDFKDCEKYWALHFPSGAIRTQLLDEIISTNQLSDNNQKFINQLKTINSSKLVFENPIFPIFRSSKSQIGILAFSEYNREDNKGKEDSSAEAKLIEKLNVDNTVIQEEAFGKVKFYPKILDSIYKGKKKPIIYYYTTNTTKTTRIKDFGILIDDCTEYYEYSFDTKNISLSDTILFGSPFQIDLIYENNPKIDSLFRKDIGLEHCFDCPSSSHLSKIFARLKGTKNVYFLFADTFPLNNQLDTPLREMVLVKNNELISLWYKEIDLFGCPCL